MLEQLKRLSLAIVLLNLLACGSGGGGDNADSPATNACASLGLNTRIINGTPCEETNSPIVALNILSRDGSGSLCSGSMITRKNVLTAAHCFIDQNVLSVFVEISGQRTYAKKVTIHPDATISGNNSSATSDVAVIEMERDLNQPTVALLTSRLSERGDIVSIFGYGRNQSGNLGNLQSGEMELSSVTNNYLIAEFDGQGSNTCNGDSGGPALYSLTNNGRTGIVGITSSGTLNTCLTGDRSFFTNIQTPSILNFIISVAQGVEVI